jgi:hypothetical protein
MQINIWFSNDFLFGNYTLYLPIRKQNINELQNVVNVTYFRLMQHFKSEETFPFALKVPEFC